MHSVNRTSLVMYRIICAKKLRLIKNLSINLSQKINNSITQSLLQVVNYMRLRAIYEEKKILYFN